MVEALCYKPEGYGFESHEAIDIFSNFLIFPTAMALGFTQPLTEMITRRSSWE
jgi:hypothetical protein